MTAANPQWVPQLEPGTRVLVFGASGGIGRALVDMLLQSDCRIGAHFHQSTLATEDRRLVPLQFALNGDGDCRKVVDAFVSACGGVDAMVYLAGGASQPCHWRDVPEDDWNQDIARNLSLPFFAARAAFPHLVQAGERGRIVLNSTESALHGGGPSNLAYAVAKYGTECTVQGLAREAARFGSTVNAVRFGFIDSGFHRRWQNRTDDQLRTRVDLIPLKRAGRVEEAAALVTYLLSGWAGFITGQVFSLAGGDYL